MWIVYRARHLRLGRDVALSLAYDGVIVRTLLALIASTWLAVHLLPEVPAQAELGQDAELLALIHEEASAGFSGVVIVSERGETLVRAVFPAGRELRVESAFWIGSLTKPITAAAVLRLSEMERLSVDDEIALFFPDAPDDKRKITVHQLLTHTSGLPHAYAADGIADRDTAVAAILALPLAGQPGVFRYSNDGFSLLAAIIETASGASYEDFVQREVFAPAGMTSSGFWPPTKDATSFAAMGTLSDGNAARPSWGHRGASGVFSTADDLARFQGAFLSGRILQPETVELAITAKLTNEDPSYGYGWFVMREGGRQVFHSGAETELQHFAWLRWFPERQTSMVVLSNAPQDIASRASRRLTVAVSDRK